jgi:hypothetical protein
LISSHTNTQIPFCKHGDNFAGYLDLVERPSFRVWPYPCPLCGAEGCAKFLQFYTRTTVYFGNTVYEDVPIGRFICFRLNPNVPPETHRTFSLLPHPLVPYSPYALHTTIALATALGAHADNAYQTSQALASQYENLNPDPTTLGRIKSRLLEALHKLKRLPEKFQQMLNSNNSSDRRTLETLADFITLLVSYHSPACGIGVSGACGLSYDWFYVFQAELSYMQRDFLVGTPSQKRRVN